MGDLAREELSPTSGLCKIWQLQCEVSQKIHYVLDGDGNWPSRHLPAFSLHHGQLLSPSLHLPAAEAKGSRYLGSDGIPKTGRCTGAGCTDSIKLGERISSLCLARGQCHPGKHLHFPKHLNIPELICPHSLGSLRQEPSLQPPAPALGSGEVGCTTATPTLHLSSLCRQIFYLLEHVHSYPIYFEIIYSHLAIHPPPCTGPNLWPLENPSKHFTQKSYFCGK